ncbi:hypothetical protein GOBAR_AA12224 [Gossypium barbadense]|uniref:Uncharacterized protein n=1 Tax=Gossypium barbadense TaxID=3634 RepID=A0A2P5XYJ4_GOSBA|nr:hypothetical protein GOBAR_AA12224 [Gossypium barbadense]
MKGEVRSCVSGGLRRESQAVICECFESTACYQVWYVHTGLQPPQLGCIARRAKCRKAESCCWVGRRGVALGAAERRRGRGDDDSVLCCDGCCVRPRYGCEDGVWRQWAWPMRVRRERWNVEVA